MPPSDWVQAPVAGQEAGRFGCPLGFQMGANGPGSGRLFLKYCATFPWGLGGGSAPPGPRWAGHAGLRRGQRSPHAPPTAATAAAGAPWTPRVRLERVRAPLLPPRAQVLDEGSNLCPIHSCHDSSQGVMDLMYAPNNRALAAATSDTWIDIYKWVVGGVGACKWAARGRVRRECRVQGAGPPPPPAAAFTAAARAGATCSWCAAPAMLLHLAPTFSPIIPSRVSHSTRSLDNGHQRLAVCAGLPAAASSSTLLPPSHV